MTENPCHAVTGPRRATTHDVDEIVVLGTAMYAESETWFPEIDEGYLRGNLEAAIESPIALVLVVGLPVHGALVAWTNEILFSRKQLAYCQFLYVAPEHRTLRTARRLLADYEQWADDVGAAPAHVGVTTGLDISPLLRRLNYQSIGTTWRKNSNV